MPDTLKTRITLSNFKTRVKKKEKMGCPISRNVGKMGLKVGEKKLDNQIRETMKNA